MTLQRPSLTIPHFIAVSGSLLPSTGAGVPAGGRAVAVRCGALTRRGRERRKVGRSFVQVRNRRAKARLSSGAPRRDGPSRRRGIVPLAEVSWSFEVTRRSFEKGRGEGMCTMLEGRWDPPSTGINHWDPLKSLHKLPALRAGKPLTIIGAALRKTPKESRRCAPG
jgi:hypothetical protein